MANELFDRLMGEIELNTRGDIYSILDKNDLLYYYLQRYEPNSERYNEKKKQYLTRLQIAAKIENILTAENLEFTTLKSFPSFPFVDSDIDIIPSDYTLGKKILQKNGFSRQWNLFELREPDKKFLVSKEAKIKCHLHKSISWNKIQAVDNSSVIGRSHIKNISGIEIRVPSNEDEILIAAAHSIFENYHIKLSDIVYFNDLNKDIDWDYIILKSKKFNWYKGLRLYLSSLNLINKKIGIKQDIPKQLVIYDTEFCDIFPLFFKYSTLLKEIYSARIFNLLKHFKFIDIIWELYIYLIVGPFWKYYRSKNKIIHLYQKGV